MKRRIENITLPDQEKQLPTVLNWWIYSSNQSTPRELAINNAERYLNDPVCKYSEIYYFAYLLYLQNIYKTFPKESITTSLVYSYDQTHKADTVSLLQKNAASLKKDTNFFGKHTYLALNTHLAGSICSVIPDSNRGTEELRIQAFRPLFYDPIWINHILHREIALADKTDPAQLEESMLFSKCLQRIKKEKYGELVITMLNNLQIPIDETTFKENMLIPQLSTQGKSKYLSQIV